MTDKQVLFTPGPLSTSKATKNAMLRDWGSRDAEFITLTQEIKLAIEKIAGVEEKAPTHNCVLIQGSGTFVIEATIDTLIPRGTKILVLINGAYGRRIAKICQLHNRPYVTLETDEDTPPTKKQVLDLLKTEKSITHVLAVHCETTSGILNPIVEVSDAVAEAGRILIIDAMSSFGALPLSVSSIKCAAIVASSNKCLEGVPGIGFAIVEKTILSNCKNNASSLSLDLYDQWQNFENTGQWRFTPPTHVLAALRQALDEHDAEGGVEGRGYRYRENCEMLVKGMKALGFKPYLCGELQSPIIVTFCIPEAIDFDFAQFYGRLHKRGFLIYPGKITKADSFRIGCIGQIQKIDIKNLVVAVADTIEEMGIKSL
ncbi:MAG: 2-aminoethylphosphonate--pyruvate transaminase [Pseudomonadota bacterium]|nr:2-aminoethylphosphonate--pyruvate transaminase [Pseudomonadota bacterium]